MAAAALLLLAGCGGPADGADAPLRVQVAGEPDEVNAFEAIAAAYEQAAPGVRVDVVSVPKKSDHLARLSTAFAAGDPPDVFVVNYREFAQFAARGAIEPVGPLLADRGVEAGDYYPEPIAAFTYDGALQCMPQNVSSLVVYTNLTAFAERGVPLPRAGLDPGRPRGRRPPRSRGTGTSGSGSSPAWRGWRRSSGRSAGRSSTTSRPPRH